MCICKIFFPVHVEDFTSEHGMVVQKPHIWADSGSNALQIHCHHAFQWAAPTPHQTNILITWIHTQNYKYLLHIIVLICDFILIIRELQLIIMSGIFSLYHYLRLLHRHTRSKVCFAKKADNPLLLACHQHPIPNINLDSIRIQTDPGQRLLSWSWCKCKSNMELRWQTSDIH